MRIDRSCATSPDTAGSQESYDVTLEAYRIVGQAIKPALVAVAAHGSEELIGIIRRIFRAGLYAYDDCHYLFAKLGEDAMYRGRIRPCQGILFSQSTLPPAIEIEAAKPVS